MKRIRIDFSSELDVQSISACLLQRLKGASSVQGDPLDRYVDKQTEIANTTLGSQRGKKAFVESAKDLKRRIGPGAEIICAVGGRTCNIIITRDRVVASFQETPPSDAIDELKAIFRSLGDGDLFES